jgi:three-Cys-motif partner protein
MGEEAFRFDEIGYWPEIKLEIVEKYGKAYTRAFKNTSLKKYYIDGFCGAGAHKSKATGETIDGSPSRALRIAPPFDGYYLIDMNSKKTAHLKQAAGGRDNVHIITADSNEYLRTELLPQLNYTKYNRALCLLDPYGLHLDWRVIRAAGQSKAIDMVLNFPVMDMNRNAIWHKAEKASPAGIARMNFFWGDESWRKAAYAPNPQGSLFGDVDIIKQRNEDIVEAFQDRLRKEAGFKYVLEALPMKNSTGAVVYYLMFASPKDIANKIMMAIFAKYR